MQTILKLLCGLIIGLLLIDTPVGSEVQASVPPSSTSTISRADQTQYLIMLGKYSELSFDRDVLSNLDSSKTNQHLDWSHLVSLVSASRLPIVAQHMSLSKIRNSACAALLHLRAPDEIAIAVAMGSDYTLLHKKDLDEVVQNTDLKQRYTGDALLCIGYGKIRWKIDEPVLINDIDTIGKTIEITRKILIRNRGTRSLVVHVESTSCGCTAASISPTLIPVNGSGVLTCKIRVSGTHLVTVDLKTDDEFRPNAVVAIRSEIPSDIVPPATLLLYSEKRQAVASSVMVQVPLNEELATVSSNKPSWFKISAKLMTSMNQKSSYRIYRITASLLAHAPVGFIEDQIELKLIHGKLRLIVIPLQGYVSDDITVNPKMVVLGNVANESLVRKIVVLEGPSDHPFSIRSISSSNYGVSGKADPRIIASAHAIEIDIQVMGAIGSWLQDRATILLSDGRTIDIDIAGIITTSHGQTNLLAVGQSAAAFIMIDDQGVVRRLSDLKNHSNLLLTFFPRCFTGGCAAHLTSLQREFPNFKRLNTEVWAVSVDEGNGDGGQLKFAKDLGLTFPLIPDVDRKLCLLYGAVQKKTDLAARMSVLIDKEGIIRWIDHDVNVETHGSDILAKMRELGMIAK